MASDEQIKRAAEMREKLGGNDRPSLNDPAVAIAEIRADEIKLLADDTNEAFSEHLRGRFIDYDETFDFSLLWTFADHPLRDLENKLNEAGIKRSIKEKRILKKDGDETIEEIEIEKEIRYESVRLKNFITNLLKRRHSVNRHRVREYIEALEAERKMGQIIDRQSSIMDRMRPGGGRIV